MFPNPDINPTVECERGKYKVQIVVGQPQIFAKKDDSPYFVPQHVFIENIEDLRDLFTCIGSVLDQVENE
jgi:hypothetical protein